MIPGALICSASSEARSYAETIWGHSTENHPDFIVVKPEGKTAQHSMERLREIRFLSQMPPYQKKKRFILIEEADRLGIMGSNVLLKTIEEPFDHTSFLLVTTRSLLPTLASRCQRLSKKEEVPHNDELEKYVELLMSVRGSFTQLTQEISRIESFIVSSRSTAKVSAKEKELYTHFVQEKILKELEGAGSIDQKKLREELCYYLLKAYKSTHLPLDLVEEKLQELLVRTERFIPLSEALESFFFETSLLPKYIF